MSQASQRPEIKTFANLESAFAGESMAHIKYRYFAKLARAAGDEETAKTFEATADQEVMHAFGHLDLLYPAATMTPAKALQIAIDGETYEYTEMRAMPPLWPRWMSRLKSRRFMLHNLRRRLRKRKNVLQRLLEWKSATPTTTRRSLPK
jgi:Rubrerythrin